MNDRWKYQHNKQLQFGRNDRVHSSKSQCCTLCSATPQTPNRNLDSSDNGGAQISEQQRVFSNEKQKNTSQMNLSMAPNFAHLLNRNPVLD
ncbi:unnamed protein product [Rotaria sp. Silwood1]|nr:unnamed protein product [Rotaria sp. Silwood1]